MSLPLRNEFPRFSLEWWESVTTFNPETGCMTWNGFADKNGYCRTWFNGKSGVLVHRIAYECFYGPFDASLKVCHSCDNPRCVHPHHLFLGTQRENLRDMFAKGRARPHGWAKGEIAQRVMSLFASHPHMTQRQLAASAGTSALTVHKILKAKGLKTTRSRRRQSTVAAPALLSEISNVGVGIVDPIHLVRTDAMVAGWRQVVGVPRIRPTQALVVWQRPRTWTAEGRVTGESVTGVSA